MNIPAEDIEHIFDGFLQLDAFANGTGISMTAFAFRNGRIYDCLSALLRNAACEWKHSNYDYHQSLPGLGSLPQRLAEDNAPHLFPVPSCPDGRLTCRPVLRRTAKDNQHDMIKATR